MPSEYTDILGLELQETGENLNSWGLRLNNALALIDDSVNLATIPLTGSLSLTNTMNAVNQARKAVLLFTDGGLSAIPTVTIPPEKRLRYVENRGATYAITFTAGGVSASLPAGRKGFILCDGTDVFVFDPIALADDARIAAQAARDLAAKWATQLIAAVEGGEFSSKEYAVGITAPLGSSKSWATKTGATIDGSEYGSKEYASGTVAPTGSAKLWASKTGSAVASGEYSAKEYAQGTATPLGSARSWSVTLGSAVAGGEYAAKEYAVGDLTATGGSAKAWAIDASSPNGTTDKSAKSYASDGAGSAILAQQWASNPENVVVTGGAFSALHYAAKAAASAAAAATFDPSSYVPKTGNVSLTGNIYDTVVDKGTVSTGTVTFDVTTGQRQRLQVGGALTIALSNKPTTAWAIVIELVNGGLATITWPTVSWRKGDGTVSTTFSDMGVALQASGQNLVLLQGTGSGTVYGRAG